MIGNQMIRHIQPYVEQYSRFRARFIKFMTSERIYPYVQLGRYHSPIGIWLLMLPALWGLIIAYDGLPNFFMLTAFVLGSCLVRGAGCTYNDLVDHKFDAEVERTADRPLPSGKLTRSQAIGFLIAQSTVAFLILLLMNFLTFCLGVLAVAIIGTYPWMKRYTYWPQVLLGFAMNYGLLMAYTAVTGSMTAEVIILYIAAILWTLGYDTIYAHQDRKDDILLGLKSSAIAMGEHTQVFLTLVYICVFVLLTLLGLVESLGFWYLSAVLGVGFIFTYQIITLDIEDPVGCRKLFQMNQWVGLIILIGLIFGYW